MSGKKKQQYKSRASGASVKRQLEWRGMSEREKQALRMWYPDSDGDGYPDMWDCQPLNPDEDISWKDVTNAYDKAREYVSRTVSDTGEAARQAATQASQAATRAAKSISRKSSSKSSSRKSSGPPSSVVSTVRKAVSTGSEAVKGYVSDSISNVATAARNVNADALVRDTKPDWLAGYKNAQAGRTNKVIENVMAISSGKPATMQVSTKNVLGNVYNTPPNSPTSKMENSLGKGYVTPVTPSPVRDVASWQASQQAKQQVTCPNGQSPLSRLGSYVTEKSSSLEASSVENIIAGAQDRKQVTKPVSDWLFSASDALEELEPKLTQAWFGSEPSILASASQNVQESVYSLLDTAGYAVSGAEAMARNPEIVVPALTYAALTVPKNLYTQAKEDPGQLASDIVVTSMLGYGLGKGASAVKTKLPAVTRTSVEHGFLLKGRVPSFSRVAAESNTAITQAEYLGKAFGKNLFDISKVETQIVKKTPSRTIDVLVGETKKGYTDVYFNLDAKTANALSRNLYGDIRNIKTSQGSFVEFTPTSRIGGSAAKTASSDILKIAKTQEPLMIGERALSSSRSPLFRLEKNVNLKKGQLTIEPNTTPLLPEFTKTVESRGKVVESPLALKQAASAKRVSSVKNIALFDSESFSNFLSDTTAQAYFGKSIYNKPTKLSIFESPIAESSLANKITFAEPKSSTQNAIQSLLKSDIQAILDRTPDTIKAATTVTATKTQQLVSTKLNVFESAKPGTKIYPIVIPGFSFGHESSENGTSDEFLFVNTTDDESNVQTLALFSTSLSTEPTTEEDTEIIPSFYMSPTPETVTEPSPFPTISTKPSTKTQSKITAPVLTFKLSTKVKAKVKDKKSTRRTKSFGSIGKFWDVRNPIATPKQLLKNTERLF